MSDKTENKTVDVIESIRQRTKLLTWVVLLIIFTILLLNIRIISTILNYIPLLSVSGLLIIVSGLVVAGFYLSRKISLHAINNLNELVIALQHEITERKQLEDELKVLSLNDELTGLYNRRGFFTLAEHQLTIAKRLRSEVFLLYVDVDNLKIVNDNFGHKEGDLLLKETANILKVTCRESDVIARIGGDEFVILPVGTTKDHAEIIISRLQKNLDIHNEKKDHSYNLSLSVGIACSDQGFTYSVDELLSKADKLMYEQKREKKGS
jgi:diguanylate cyclase (GGDEF)-like protein